MKKKLPHCLQSCSYFLETNFARNTFLLFCFFALSLSAFAQGSGYPDVDAGADVVLACNETCTQLNADYLYTGLTDTYSVSSIPYDPFPYTGLANPVSVGIDDVWSSAIPLPFDFCFYGDVYTSAHVGSNGVVSFNSQTPGGFCDYALDADEYIPGGVPHKNAIMVYHDINPLYGTNEIGWELLGTAPYRILVVSFSNVPYYNFANPNNSATSTFQIVMYETTNAIEIFIESKPDPHTAVSSPINGGRAVLGIQNNSGTEGETAPGRNTGVWSATNEAWRYTPNGEPNVEFSWLDADGVVIGTDTSINVCPTDQTTVYTAQAVYTNCNGDVVTVTDDVTVTTTATYSVDLGADQELCDTTSYDITAEIINGDATNATFLWSTGETTQTITVTTSGTYTVEVTLDSCTLIRDVTINFNEPPLIDLGSDITTCFETPIILDASPSNYNPANMLYVWSLDGVVLTGETSPTLNATQLGVYSVTVTIDNCSSTDEVTITQNPLNVSLGDDFSSCFETSETLTAEALDFDPTLATYEWSLDGSVITGETNSTLIISEIGIYTVTVSVGSCTGTDSITVSEGANLEVSVDADFEACPGENYTLTATTSEEGVTFQWFLNDTAIEGATNNTLEVNLGDDLTDSQIYKVVISAEGCTGEASVTITLLPCDGVISQGISPNGDGYNDTLDLSFLNDRSGIKKLQIFNRYGTQIYEQVNYTNQWMGQTQDGEKLPTGTYFYVIDLASNDAVYGQQATGWIYLNQKAN